MSFLLFILGFGLLIRGAQWLVEGGSALARRYGVSELVVGLTVVAFGTSLPELVVNLFAGSKSAELAIGNILGSNIANILLVLGVIAILKPLTIRGATVYREILFNIGATLMLGVLVSERLLSAGGFDGLDRIDGVVLMSYFAIFIHYTFGSRSSLAKEAATKVSQRASSMAVPLIKVLAGSLMLYFGGRWIVGGALDIADTFGVSQSLIGLTVVALGTSLPELATSVYAVANKKTDIAVGNIVGSNLFNIFWVLGLSAYLNPLPFNDDLFIDVVITLGVALMLFLTMVLGRPKHQISKREGYAFVGLYLVYIIYLVLRG